MAARSHNVIDYWLYVRAYVIRLWMKILYRGQGPDQTVSLIKTHHTDLLGKVLKEL
jgi:hypothetical protein